LLIISGGCFIYRYCYGVRKGTKPLTGTSALAIEMIALEPSSADQEDSKISEDNERVENGTVVPYLNYRSKNFNG
jgi:hypothetical protein